MSYIYISIYLYFCRRKVLIQKSYCFSFQIHSYRCVILTLLFHTSLTYFISKTLKNLQHHFNNYSLCWQDFFITKIDGPTPHVVTRRCSVQKSYSEKFREYSQENASVEVNFLIKKIANKYLWMNIFDTSVANNQTKIWMTCW